MALTELSMFVVVTDDGVKCLSRGREQLVVPEVVRVSFVMPTVVVMRGEHDRATTADLVAEIWEAIALDDADLVLDLSGVTFMDASTLRLFVATRTELHRQGRTLALRSPSRIARRLLTVCGLNELLEVSPPAASLPELKAS